MTYEACKNADGACTPAKCTLTCNDNSCRQTCNAYVECTLECDGSSCVQTCVSPNCRLKCHAKSCTQICNSAECTLECDRRKQTCLQICNANRCIKKTFVRNAASTRETATTEAFTKDSKHDHTSGFSCTGK